MTALHISQACDTHVLMMPLPPIDHATFESWKVAY